MQANFKKLEEELKISDSSEKEETKTKCEEQKAFQIKLIPTVVDNSCSRLQKEITIKKDKKLLIKQSIQYNITKKPISVLNNHNLERKDEGSFKIKITPTAIEKPLQVKQKKSQEKCIKKRDIQFFK